MRQHVRRSLITEAFLFIALATVASACAKDTFIAEMPAIGVSILNENYHYQATQPEALTIDLGQVPLYSTRQAAFLINTRSHARLTVKSIEQLESVGSEWRTPALFTKSITGDEWSATGPLPAYLLPGQESKVMITYAPVVEGSHKLVLQIASDDPDHLLTQVTVIAEAIFVGQPDIEVAYPGYIGPQPAECDTTGHCVAPSATPINFGNIVLGTQGTARLVIRNTAECAPNPSNPDPCQSCALTIDANPTGRNIGLGFAPGTNDAGHFSFNGSTRLPAVIQQKNLSPACNASGELSLLINFTAPTTEGTYTTTIVIESDDPDERTIEIPVVATALNAPVAMAKLRDCTTSNTTQCTRADSIDPLTRVYLDGSGSYDPAAPARRIVDYQWVVSEYPSGSNPNDFQIRGNGTQYFDFWTPLAGRYVVSLKVRNDQGITSGETEQSKVTFMVIPKSRVHIQLVWDDTTNDQDLHLTNVSQSDAVCTTPADCFYRDKQPRWFTTHPAGQGPNPRLDIDDVNGQGPENINIDQPNPGTYRVYAHYFRGTTPTRLTLRIWLNGLPVAEYRRVVNAAKDVWAIADITWRDDGTGYATAIASDRPGEIGVVERIAACTNLSGF